MIIALKLPKIKLSHDNTYLLKVKTVRKLQSNNTKTILLIHGWTTTTYFYITPYIVVHKNVPY